MLNDIIGNSDSFYFIGIGGVSMSALAKYMHSCGKTVAGSDVIESVYTKELTSLGINVAIFPNTESVLNFDVIIYTDAIKDNDVQLREARLLSKTIIPRGQLLYEISKSFGSVIAVSGCHGKTTCASMLAHIFKSANKKFCAHIGGRDIGFTNYFFNGKDYFITEACEFKKNFLRLKPDIAVVLNSGVDHVECYGSEKELKNSYIRFANSANVSVGLYGDECTQGLSFGFDKMADYSARQIYKRSGKYSFVAYEGDIELGEISLNVYGKHNVLNALAAIAAARSSHIDFQHIKQGLFEFQGVERRFENLGVFDGVNYIADYAHHPDEILATVRTAKSITEGKVFIVFQPHTYSRTKALFKQFLRVLSGQNNLLIYRTYAAREYYDDAGSALTLSQKLKKSRYGDDVRDIIDFISVASDGDTVLFLGAGDIYDIAKEIIETL